jgi:hypothetical protein
VLESSRNLSWKLGGSDIYILSNKSFLVLQIGKYYLSLENHELEQYGILNRLKDALLGLS